MPYSSLKESKTHFDRAHSRFRLVEDASKPDRRVYTARFKVERAACDAGTGGLVMRKLPQNQRRDEPRKSQCHTERTRRMRKARYFQAFPTRSKSLCDLCGSFSPRF